MRTNRRGFTLIEFLIALVIIGFIVALLVNFFADPLDQAQKDAQVTRTIDNFRTLENAIQLLKARTGCSTGDAGCLTRISNGELTSSGILSAWPAFDAAIFTDGVATGGLLAESNGVNIGGPAAHADLWGASRGVMWLELMNGNAMGVTEAFCKAFNERLGHGAVVIEMAATAVIDPSKGAQCVKDTDAAFMNAAGDLAVVWPALTYTP